MGTVRGGGGSPEQDRTSAKSLTIELPEGRFLPRMSFLIPYLNFNGQRPFGGLYKINVSIHFGRDF